MEVDPPPRRFAGELSLSRSLEDDNVGLDRFVDAQAGIYDTALSEIRGGRKRTHWTWYVFPQIDGLGSSGMSKRFSIKSADEARAFLGHPVLGPRLQECAEALLQLKQGSATEILGSPDDLKLRSCATLFASVSPPGSVFERVLERFYGGEPDARTLQLLGREA